MKILMKKVIFVFRIPVDHLGFYTPCMGNHCSQMTESEVLKQIYKGNCNQQQEIKYRWKSNVASEFPNWAQVEEFNIQVHSCNTNISPPDDF